MKTAVKTFCRADPTHLFSTPANYVKWVEVAVEEGEADVLQPADAGREK
jgi:hypothetical protein